MYHVDNETAIAVMPTIGAVKYTDPHWFTAGDASNKPTYPGPDWFNMMQAEHLNVLAAAGITPRKDDNTQLTQAIKAILGKPEAGWVQSVNGKTPDEAGALTLSATDVGAVAKVNGVAPDASGNVTISIPAQAVSSVNGKTGAVSLVATDVDAVAKVNGVAPDASGNVTISIPAQAVSSVNGKTGAVSLTAADVGALTSSTANSTYQAINTASKALNGWHKDTNTGVITQWGKNTSTVAGNATVTFPIAFPAACSNVQNTMVRNTNDPGEDSWGFITSFTNTTASVSGDSLGSYWEAKGY